MRINRDLIYITIIVALIATCAQFYYSFSLQPALQERNERQVEVFYNKEILANEQVINVINEAQEYILFAIYTFTRQDIQNALIGAKFRGVDVRGIMDKKQSTELEPQRKVLQELQNAGIPIVFNTHSAIMHLKTLVTEKAYVSGSYNWTASGTDRNDEILEIGRDKDLLKKHQKVLDTLWREYQFNLVI